jgi:hypothetical protein
MEKSVSTWKYDKPSCAITDYLRVPNLKFGIDQETIVQNFKQQLGRKDKKN